MNESVKNVDKYFKDNLCPRWELITRAEIFFSVVYAPEIDYWFKYNFDWKNCSENKGNSRKIISAFVMVPVLSLFITLYYLTYRQFLISASSLVKGVPFVFFYYVSFISCGRIFFHRRQLNFHH